MTFDVYFGEADPPQLVGSTVARHWTPPSLGYDVQYYWQIVAHNPNGTTAGPVWTFSTAASWPGDLNCDGFIDFADINPFGMILTDPAAWQQTYPDCPFANGDVNGDTNVDLGDINPFVRLLVGQ